MKSESRIMNLSLNKNEVVVDIYVLLLKYMKNYSSPKIFYAGFHEKSV